jgi:hypothetical protein
MTSIPKYTIYLHEIYDNSHTKFYPNGFSASSAIIIQVKVKENFGVAPMFVFYIKKQLHTLRSHVSIQHFSGFYLMMSVSLTQQPY